MSIFLGIIGVMIGFCIFFALLPFFLVFFEKYEEWAFSKFMEIKSKEKDKK